MTTYNLPNEIFMIKVKLNTICYVFIRIKFKHVNSLFQQQAHSTTTTTSLFISMRLNEAHSYI